MERHFTAQWIDDGFLQPSLREELVDADDFVWIPAPELSEMVQFARVLVDGAMRAVVAVARCSMAWDESPEIAVRCLEETFFVSVSYESSKDGFVAKLRTLE